jgi:DNA-binding transcriptional LysR family regulator
MDHLGTLNTFVRVVETGSFSAVARETGLSKSAVTRSVAQLENHFDLRLFQRTTRRLTLTQDGEDLLAHAKRLIEVAEDMEGALGSRRPSAPTGLVRVGVSMAASAWIVRRLPELRERYPDLQVELIVGSDRFGDLIEERLDLVLLGNQTPPINAVARSIGTFGRIPVASPAYLAQSDAPIHPSDLTLHQCIIHDLGPDSGTWRYIGPEGPVEVKVSGSFRANNSEVVLRAVLAGQGIGQMSELQAFDDLQAGRLVRLLPNYAPVRQQIYLAYPSRRHLSPRVRVMLDFLIDSVRRLTALVNRESESQGQNSARP